MASEPPSFGSEKIPGPLSNDELAMVKHTRMVSIEAKSLSTSNIRSLTVRHHNMGARPCPAHLNRGAGPEQTAGQPGRLSGAAVF